MSENKHKSILNKIYETTAAKIVSGLAVAAVVVFVDFKLLRAEVDSIIAEVSKNKNKITSLENSIEEKLSNYQKMSCRMAIRLKAYTDKDKEEFCTQE